MKSSNLYTIFGIAFFAAIILLVAIAFIVYMLKNRRRRYVVRDSEQGMRKFQVELVKIHPSTEIVGPRLSPKELEKVLSEIARPNVTKEPTSLNSKVDIVKLIEYTATDEITLSGSEDNDVIEFNAETTQNESQLASTSSYSMSTTETLSSADESDTLLERMIKNGPRKFDFTSEEICNLLEQGAKIFLSEPSLVEASIPCAVYGDFHGQYSDLYRWFKINKWPPSMTSIFLGDLVDRGTHGIEIVALLTALKIRFPDKVYVIRGNHEEETLNRAYNFFNEVQVRFPETGKEVYEHFKKLFSTLPLAILIGKRVLGMHGGISSRMESLKSIRDIERPINEFKRETLACDLVWSDPDLETSNRGFHPNFDRSVNALGIGQLFAADTVLEACRKFHIDLIVRGHQTPKMGYAFFAEAHMLTLFSAPGYKGYTLDEINHGASIIIDENLRITIKQLIVSEKFRQRRMEAVERLNSQFKNMTT